MSPGGGRGERRTELGVLGVLVPGVLGVLGVLVLGVLGVLLLGALGVLLLGVLGAQGVHSTVYPSGYSSIQQEGVCTCTTCLSTRGARVDGSMGGPPCQYLGKTGQRPVFLRQSPRYGAYPCAGDSACVASDVSVPVHARRVSGAVDTVHRQVLFFFTVRNFSFSRLQTALASSIRCRIYDHLKY